MNKENVFANIQNSVTFVTLCDVIKKWLDQNIWNQEECMSVEKLVNVLIKPTPEFRLRIIAGLPQSFCIENGTYRWISDILVEAALNRNCLIDVTKKLDKSNIRSIELSTLQFCKEDKNKNNNNNNNNCIIDLDFDPLRFVQLLIIKGDGCYRQIKPYIQQFKNLHIIHKLALCLFWLMFSETKETKQKNYHHNEQCESLETLLPQLNQLYTELWEQKSVQDFQHWSQCINYDQIVSNIPQ